MFILIWLDFLENEIITYAFSDLPGDIREAMLKCHGHMCSVRPTTLPFHLVHNYISDKEDCKIAGPYQGDCTIVITGIF